MLAWVTKLSYCLRLRLQRLYVAVFPIRRVAHRGAWGSYNRQFAQLCTTSRKVLMHSHYVQEKKKRHTKSLLEVTFRVGYL